MEYIQIGATIIIALVGWVIAHRFTSKRDLANKQRESVLSLTIECYNALSKVMADTRRDNADIEVIDALIKIQCFGTTSQMEMAKNSLQSIAHRNEYKDLGDLLTSLRNSFRKELGLCSIDENVAIVHRTRKS